MALWFELVAKYNPAMLVRFTSRVVAAILGEDINITSLRDVPSAELAGDVDILEEYLALLRQHQMDFLMPTKGIELGDHYRHSGDLEKLPFPEILRYVGSFKHPAMLGRMPASVRNQNGVNQRFLEYQRRIDHFLRTVILGKRSTSRALDVALHKDDVPLIKVLDDWKQEIRDRAALGLL